MIVPAAISQRFSHSTPHLQCVERLVREKVLSLTDSHGYGFVGRSKRIESLTEKIESGRFPAWSSLDDMYACAIIVPTINEEAGALTAIQSEFSTVDIKARGSTQKSPDVFRFDATRFVGRIKPSEARGASEADKIRFEIQIRTAFEHAWAVTTHALAYKATKVDWRRIRLAAQLKASVEQLDTLVLGYDRAIDYVSSSHWPEIAAKERIEQFFGPRVSLPPFRNEHAPASWMRFCDNLFSVIISSQAPGTAGRDRLAATNQALDAIANYIAGLGEIMIPRSITLLQFCIGALATEKVITGKLNRYVPLVTEELTTFFPAAVAVGSGFLID